MTIEEAREDFKSKYLPMKGVLGVCSKELLWKPGYGPGIWHLNVYVHSVDIVDQLPISFQGFTCIYTICPEGIHPGCD